MLEKHPLDDNDKVDRSLGDGIEVSQRSSLFTTLSPGSVEVKWSYVSTHLVAHESIDGASNAEETV